MRDLLLQLVMIVRDEAAGIGRTLASVAEHIDWWTILDTGSADGTQGKIREALRSVPGDLYEEPFVPFEDTGIIDFAATRNRALELAGERAVFTLFLSGDEVLDGGAALRGWCDQRRGDTAGAYLVRVAQGQNEYISARLVRAAAGWRYQGPTHEVLMPLAGESFGDEVLAAHIQHSTASAGSAKWRRRMEQDVRVLSRVLERDPEDRRALYYLAWTCESLGLTERAMRLYERRIALGGKTEDAYFARYRLACCAERAGYDWRDVQQLYLDAHAFAPHRAEPLVRIAQHWYTEGGHPLCYLFSARAAGMPMPTNALGGILREDYERIAPDLLSVSAWHVGRLQEGLEALQRCLAVQPGHPRLLTNLARYQARMTGRRPQGASLSPPEVAAINEHLAYLGVDAEDVVAETGATSEVGNLHG